MEYWRFETGNLKLETDNAKHTAAHRDGSPYPLCTGHLSGPQEVGRTVSVSREAPKITNKAITQSGNKAISQGANYGRDGTVSFTSGDV
jgi:hypothetical protein